MYGAVFVNFLLFLITLLWLILKSPDSIISILLFIALIFGNLSLFLSYPLYFYIVKKKHYHGLEKRVYRLSIKWATFIAFIVSGLLALSAFDLFTFINLGLFLALGVAILMGMLKKRV